MKYNIELIIKAGNNDLLKFNKATKNVTNAITYEGAVRLKDAKIEELTVNTTGSKKIAGVDILRENFAMDDARVHVDTDVVSDDSVIIVTPMERLLGDLYVGDINPGVSFEIVSTSMDDRNKRVSWLLLNPI